MCLAFMVQKSYMTQMSSIIIKLSSVWGFECKRPRYNGKTLKDSLEVSEGRLHQTPTLGLNKKLWKQTETGK